MEYHGFVHVLAHLDPHRGGDHRHMTREVVRALQQETEWRYFVDGKFIELGGEWYFRAHGKHNHAPVFIKTRELLEKLVARAPDSYGLFYVRDEEDRVPELREFYRVLIIRQGTITQSFDPFLSPEVPVVLDPFDINNL